MSFRANKSPGSIISTLRCLLIVSIFRSFVSFERTFKISRIVTRRCNTVLNGDVGDNHLVIILSHYAFLLLLERESIVLSRLIIHNVFSIKKLQIRL